LKAEGFVILPDPSKPPDRCGDDGDHGKTVQHNEDNPLDHNGLAMMKDQGGEQVQDRNAHAVDGMEKHTENKEYLEERADINIIDDVADLPALSFYKCGKDMQCNENCHPHPANAMQDVGQVRTLSLILQPRLQAYVPIQAH